MRQKLLFIKMIWRVMRNKEQGWIWLKMADREQQSFIKNDKTVVVNIRYIGVDKRVIEKIVDRIETPKQVG